jgi:hypothetical protein
VRQLRSPNRTVALPGRSVHIANRPHRCPRPPLAQESRRAFGVVAIAAASLVLVSVVASLLLSRQDADPVGTSPSVEPTFGEGADPG